MNLSNDDLMAGFAAYASVDELATVLDDEAAPGTIPTPGTPASVIVISTVVLTAHFTC